MRWREMSCDDIFVINEIINFHVLIGGLYTQSAMDAFWHAQL